MARQPFGASLVYPALEVFRDEPKRAVIPANAYRGDAACSCSLVQPGSRDAKSRRYFGRLEKVGRAGLIATHGVIDRERPETANDFRQARSWAVRDQRHCQRGWRGSRESGSSVRDRPGALSPSRHARYPAGDWSWFVIGCAVYDGGAKWRIARD